MRVGTEMQTSRQTHSLVGRGGDLGVGGSSWILTSSQQQMVTSEQRENERTKDTKERERETEGD